MATGNLQATTRNCNMPLDTAQPGDMLTIPENEPAAPRMHEAARQDLMYLYEQAIHSKREHPSSTESKQTEIRLYSAVKKLTERYRRNVEAGRPLQQVFRDFQIFSQQGQIPMMLAMMRVVGNYDFVHAELLARAYRDAIFDPTIAAVLEKVDSQAGEKSAAEQMSTLLNEVRRIYEFGDRYADWDANG